MQPIYPNNYIKVNDQFLEIFFPYSSGVHNKYTIDVLFYMLNELSRAIALNSDIKYMTISLTDKEANMLIQSDIVAGKKRRVNKINQLKEIIFEELDNVRIDSLEVITSISIFSSVKYIKDEHIINAKFTPDFIDYFKQCKVAKTDYFKIYLDMMISLSSLRSKMLFAILCKYDDQIKKHGSTNETDIDYLKSFFDEGRSYNHKNKTWVFSIRNEDLVNTIERHLKLVNSLIELKNKTNNTHMRQYQINWIREATYPNTTKQGKLIKFKISYKEQEPKKQEQKKEQEQVTVDNTVDDRNIYFEF